MLQSLEFEEKQLFLRDVLSQVVVGDGRKVSVKGAIPLESEAQNNEFCTESRDSSYTIPHLEFRFRFKLPNPRKERIIIERDELGRILRSEPPAIII